MSEPFDTSILSVAARPHEHAGHVWVVDDDDVRESLSFALRPRYFTKTFPSLSSFFKEADLDAPGCLIVADELAHFGSLGVLEELRRLRSPVSVVFLSTETDVRTAVQMLQEGAVSVFEKPVDPEELSHAVERALARSARLARRYRLETLYETLSRREKQIFVLVCLGLKNGDIAKLLNLSQRTVEVHRAHIGRKLGDAAPIRLLYELVQTTGENILTAQFDDLDMSAIESALAADAPSPVEE